MSWLTNIKFWFVKTPTTAKSLLQPGDMITSGWGFTRGIAWLVISSERGQNQDSHIITTFNLQTRTTSKFIMFDEHLGEYAIWRNGKEQILVSDSVTSAVKLVEMANKAGLL